MKFFTVPVTGGTIDFSLDEGFRHKLESLGVSISTTGTVTQTGSAPLAYEFPEVKGEINQTLSHGGLGTTNDGIKFTQPASPFPKEVNWASIGIGFENGFGGEGGDVATARWTGVSAVGPIGQIEFGSNPAFEGGTFNAGPISATLSPYAAGPLNEAFAAGKGPVFAAGEPLGSFSFSVGVR